MREIGTIKLLQIQTGSLKIGTRPTSTYDPAPILVVERLLLSQDGAQGVLPNGERIVDIHNARHPQSRNNGDNAISIGFTAHYAAMRQRFGPHMRDGVAGENMIIDSADSFTLDDLGGRVGILNAASGQTFLFDVLKIAAPCIEFSHFAAGKNAAQGDTLSGTDLKAALQFLGAGRRGFHIAPVRAYENLSVQLGDTVFVAR
ncbi:MAG: hypothetical protein HXY40_02465 [Chloroflexi bacterium]|nr:hypothetical protein [Chloroflexota bacterium]